MNDYIKDRLEPFGLTLDDLSQEEVALLKKESANIKRGEVNLDNELIPDSVLFEKMMLKQTNI